MQNDLALTVGNVTTYQGHGINVRNNTSVMWCAGVPSVVYSNDIDDFSYAKRTKAMEIKLFYCTIMGALSGDTTFFCCPFSVSGI